MTCSAPELVYLRGSVPGLSPINDGAEPNHRNCPPNIRNACQPLVAPTNPFRILQTPPYACRPLSPTYVHNTRQHPSTPAIPSGRPLQRLLTPSDAC